jgi:hypothetical protein
MEALDFTYAGSCATPNYMSIIFGFLWALASIFFHENVPKIAKFHTNITTVYRRHLLPLLLKILSRLHPVQNEKLGMMII